MRRKDFTHPRQTVRRGLGDVWTFLSIDPETKLIPSFLVGQRDRYHTAAFMEDLASRLNNRIQLSSDAMGAYPDAVEMAFGAEIDYGQIVKEYSSPTLEDQRKYSPATLSAVYKTAIVGDPNPDKVCTSYIERANLTMRTHCKRLARLTLAFSKKLPNFKAAIALNIAYYNLVKTHGSLRCTPAMAAGIETSHWTVADLGQCSLRQSKAYRTRLRRRTAASLDTSNPFPSMRSFAGKPHGKARSRFSI
jgi:IS1 family transposase